MTIACEQANSLAFAMYGQAIPVMFDFVDPIKPGWDLGSPAWQAWCKLYSTHAA
jgi:hypothetical protein